MTSSDKVNGRSRGMENELKMFWRLSAEVSILKRTNLQNVCPEDLINLRDELDVLSDMSVWLNLRICIRAALCSLDKMSEALEAVA